VLALDESANMAAFIHGRWKLVIGHFGNSGWSSEPLSEFVLSAGASPIGSGLGSSWRDWLIFDGLALAEDALRGLGDLLYTRDETMFLGECTHVIVNTIRRRFMNSRDLYQEGLMDATRVFSNRSVLLPHAGWATSPFTAAGEPVPLALFDLASDPHEKVNLAPTHAATVAEVSAALDVLWVTRPKQFDWRMTCDRIGFGTPGRPIDTAFAYPQDELGDAVCLARTSHLHSAFDLSHRSIDPAAVRCRFDVPFVRDADPRPCGGLRMSNFYEHARKIARVRMGKLLAVCALLWLGVLALLWCSLRRLCHGCCSRRSAAAAARDCESEAKKAN
jgi:hypothetical protein